MVRFARAVGRAVAQAVVMLALGLMCGLPWGLHGGAPGVAPASADTGHFKAERIAAGSDPPVTFSTWCPTSGSQQMVGARNDRPDLTCVNVSSYTVYFGSSGPAGFLTANSVPVLSTGTVRFGAFPGRIFCAADGSSGSANVRCWEGRTQ